MTGHAEIVREFIEQPWDDPTVGNGAAIAALDALVAERIAFENAYKEERNINDRLVAERDEARRKYEILRTDSRLLVGKLLPDAGETG